MRLEAECGQVKLAMGHFVLRRSRLSAHGHCSPSMALHLPAPSLVLLMQMHCTGASIPAQAANPAEFQVLWECHFSKHS